MAILSGIELSYADTPQPSVYVPLECSVPAMCLLVFTHTDIPYRKSFVSLQYLQTSLTGNLKIWK